jgi:hypothetical protein
MVGNQLTVEWKEETNSEDNLTKDSSMDDVNSMELSKLQNDKKQLELEVDKLRKIIANSFNGVQSFETEQVQNEA